MLLPYYIVVIMMLLALLMLCFVSSWSWLIEFSIVNLKTLVLEFSIFLDKEASIFVSTVCIIYAMVFLYSLSYLSEEIYLKRFLSVLTLFVMSMCVLILSGSLFNSLIGWDGLGVTSFFLILFYYSNSSYKASTLTFLMNRVGDCFFILTLTSIFLLGESQIYFTTTPYPTWLGLLLVLTGITKSAQIPFSTWLPAAMEAPTPVSSLVHSSTLVTAGIFLLYRYNLIWSNTKELLMVLSISTCFMAALSALVESDLKKLIALSTLSQLGFIMFSLSLSLLTQGFLHMIMHAYFKALLFMCAGLMIHSYKGTQNIFNMALSNEQSPLLVSIMSCSLLSMMGLPFMAGFYSKDLIVDTLKSTEWSILVVLLLMASFVCTVLYSVRVIWYLMMSKSAWHSMGETSYAMTKPMIPLAILSCFGGSLASWVMAEVELFVNSSKVMIFLLISLTILTYWVLSEVNYSYFLESKWNLESFNLMLSSMFFNTTLMYQSTSDLVGIPEILNKKLTRALMAMANRVELTMIQYSGNLEVALFLVVSLALMLL